MAFGFYKAVTIQTGQVPSAQSNFPAVLPFLSGDADFATVANGGKAQNSNGYDIRPYADSALTTPLTFELLWYEATTGKFEMYVKVPTLQDAAVVYMAVGDSGISTDGSDGPNTFGNSFAAVAHFGVGSALGGSTVGVHESVNNGNGRTGNTTAITGPFGGGGVETVGSGYIAWDGFGGVLNVNVPGSTDHGIAFWVKQSSPEGNKNLFLTSLGGGSIFGGTWYYRWDNHWYWDDGDASNGRIHADFTSHIGAWTRVVMTGKGDNSAGALYFNGVKVASRVIGNTPTGTLQGLITPYSPTITTDYDEYWYANSVRSDDWWTADFNNQSNLSTFWSKGSITVAGGGSTTYNVTQDASLSKMAGARSVAVAAVRSSSMLPFSSAAPRRAGKVSTGSTSLPSVTMTRSTGKISPASMSVMITLLPRSISKQMASAASLLAATVSKQTTRTFSASALPFASTLSTLKVFLITLLASMSTFTVSQSRRVSKSLSTSLNLSPVLTRATSKINQASITVQASLGTLKVILRTLAASMLTFTATRTTSIRKVHATSLNFSASTAKSVIITLAAGLTFAAQRAISRAKTFSATLGMTAALVMDYTRTSLWGFKRAKAKKTTMTPTRKDMNNE